MGVVTGSGVIHRLKILLTSKMLLIRWFRYLGTSMFYLLHNCLTIIRVVIVELTIVIDIQWMRDIVILLDIDIVVACWLLDKFV